MPDKTKVKERRRRLAAASKARREERKRLQVIEDEERERRYRKDLVELKKDREVLDLFNGLHSHTLDAHATIKFLDRSVDLDEHAKHAFKRVTLTRCEKDPKRKIRGLTQLQRTAREAAAAQKRCIDTSTPSVRVGLSKYARLSPIFSIYFQKRDVPSHLSHHPVDSPAWRGKTNAIVSEEEEGYRAGAP